ncbi:hypothetical protein D9M68_552450 [compost metagenome]
MLDHATYGGHLSDVGQGLQFKLEEPVLQGAQLRQVVPTAAVHQGVLEDPANPSGIRTQRRFRGGRQAALDLAEVFQHAGTGPVQVGAILENHINEAVPEEGIAPHRFRPRDRKHGGRQRIGDLVLDNLWRLARIRCADDHLDVGEVGQRIHRHVLYRPDAPSGGEQGGQYDQEAVGDRPANQCGNHGWPPSFSTRSTTRPLSVWRTVTRTLSPALMPTIRVGSASG